MLNEKSLIAKIEESILRKCGIVDIDFNKVTKELRSKNEVE